MKLDLSIVLGAGRRRHPVTSASAPPTRRPTTRRSTWPAPSPPSTTSPAAGPPGTSSRRSTTARPRTSASTSTSATTSATTGPTSSSRPPPACGTRGRTTPSCSTGRPAYFADPDKVHELDYDGEWFSVRGPAHRAPLAPGPAGAAPGRLVGPGPRLRRPVGRADLHRRPRHRGRPRRTTRTRRSASAEVGRDPAVGARCCRWPTRSSASRGPTPRSASSCSSTTWSTRRRRSRCCPSS